MANASPSWTTKASRDARRATGKLLFKTDTGRAAGLCGFLPDGKLLAVGGGDTGKPAALYLLDTVGRPTNRDGTRRHGHLSCLLAGRQTAGDRREMAQHAWSMRLPGGWSHRC
jgi:hypothetical protein